MDYFKRGAEVEISSNDEGFRGSWYAGTVIRMMKKGKVLVEYKTIMEDELGQRRLRETLDLVQLRPPPPRENHREFKLSDEVDVYHHDGWWEGVITRVSKDGRFGVYFRPTGEQKKYKPSDLRLHREWVDYERWVPPLETEGEAAVVEVRTEAPSPEIPKDVTETMEWGFSQGAQVEVKTDEEGFEGAWLPATVISQLKKDKFLVQYQSLRNEADTEFLREEADSANVRPQPPETASVDSFKLLQKVDAWFNDCWWSGAVSKVLRHQKYVVYFTETREEMKFKHGDLRQHQDWIDGKWIVPDESDPQPQVYALDFSHTFCHQMQVLNSPPMDLEENFVSHSHHL